MRYASPRGVASDVGNLFGVPWHGHPPRKSTIVYGGSGSMTEVAWARPGAASFVEDIAILDWFCSLGGGSVLLYLSPSFFLDGFDK